MCGTTLDSRPVWTVPNMLLLKDKYENNISSYQVKYGKKKTCFLGLKRSAIELYSIFLKMIFNFQRRHRAFSSAMKHLMNWMWFLRSAPQPRAQISKHLYGENLKVPEQTRRRESKSLFYWSALQLAAHSVLLCGAVSCGPWTTSDGGVVELHHFLW